MRSAAWPLQLRVAEAVPALDHAELYHQYIIHVGPASLGALVVVEAFEDWPEGRPVYDGIYLGQPVDLLVYSLRSVKDVKESMPDLRAGRAIRLTEGDRHQNRGYSKSSIIIMFTH